MKTVQDGRGGAVRRESYLTGCSAAALALAAVIGSGGAALAQTAGPAAENQVEQVVVTGSRIAPTGFTTPTPVTVVGSEAITQTGAVDIAQVLADVPSFRPTRTTSTFGAGSAGNTGSQTLDLRGLGDTRTLVLVDGRRFVPSSVQGTVDLNLIPTSLIDRVEVVTGGASAQYGSDAVAGVANIILNTKLMGVRASAQYGISDATDNQTYAGSLAWGGEWLGGKAHTVVAFDYSHNSGAGNCFTRDWCQPAWTNFSNPLYGTGPGKNGMPARITAQPATMATMTPGGIINSSALKGTAFDFNGNPYKYQYGFLPGQFFQIGGEGYGLNPYMAGPLLKVPVKRDIFYTHTDLELGGGVTGSIELNYGHSIAVSRGNSPNDFDLVLNADNAFLPASVAAQMRALNINSVTFGRQGMLDWGFSYNKGDSRTARVVAAFKGDFGNNWKWDAYYQYGQNNYTATRYNDRQTARYRQAMDAVRAPNGQIVCRSTLTDPNNGCAPLDLIGVGNISQAAKAWISGGAVNTTRIRQHVAAANVTGSLFALPAGDLAVATGVEFRTLSTNTDADPISKAGGWFLGNNPGAGGKVDVEEGYVEATAPLMKDMWAVRRLELNGAVRLTNYSTSGLVTTWKIGGVWEPMEEFRFRVTRSRDIRAPNINELFGGLTSGTSRVFDRRNQLDYLSPTLTGSNPNLVPEKADTWTVGWVFQPTGILSRARLSVDYYDIKVQDAVTQIGAQQILDRCFLGAADICKLVTYNPNGTPALIQNPWLNLAQLHAEGVDIEAAYNQPTSIGDFRFRFLASYVAHLSTTDAAGTIDRAGQTGLSTGATPGIPHWSLDASLNYSIGGFSANINSKYVPPGRYDVTQLGPDDPGYNINLATSASTNRVSDALYFDIGARYRFKMSGGRWVEIFGTVDNVTDRDPPLAVQNAVATNPILFDTIGRTYMGGVRLAF